MPKEITSGSPPKKTIIFSDVKKTTIENIEPTNIETSNECPNTFEASYCSLSTIKIEINDTAPTLISA